ncbi:MAG: iron-containing alcohol dehydrogenase [Mariprofundaceae bacterium]|nr:iron-containing alcohol dehydrogenase [Mariprofundaceae bacterium]
MIKPNPFSFASTPHIHFGSGKRTELVGILSGFGQRVLLVTGGQSFDASPACQKLWGELQIHLDIQRVRVKEEPSPCLVDEAVAEYRDFLPDSVLAIGGGSAVDAAKAIAGLLPLGRSVMEYLEGVGKGEPYHGPSTPFVAMPTTAGTGGETSKNAVLSVQGDGGFKKSFRHEKLAARHVILDPELTLSCPPDVTAACGMDAMTQLLESYVSSNANPITDALALSGLKMVRDCLVRAVEQGDDLKARAGMLYAASISGLTLANAGLGSVHGLASPLGAFFPIPHGVICGTLVFEASGLNIEIMQLRQPENPALTKYAEVGRLMTKQVDLNDHDARLALIDLLGEWTAHLNMPRLSGYGVKNTDVARVVTGSRGNSMKTNPIELSDEEIAVLIRSRL